MEAVFRARPSLRTYSRKRNSGVPPCDPDDPAAASPTLIEPPARRATAEGFVLSASDKGSAVDVACTDSTPDPSLGKIRFFLCFHNYLISSGLAFTSPTTGGLVSAIFSSTPFALSLAESGRWLCPRFFLVCWSWVLRCRCFCAGFERFSCSRC